MSKPKILECIKAYADCVLHTEVDEEYSSPVFDIVMYVSVIGDDKWFEIRWYEYGEVIKTKRYPTLSELLQEHNL